MSESLPLILEDAHGERRETHSARVAVRLEGRELWFEADGMGGVTIYAESLEGEAEIPLLVVRPQAVNQVSLSVELEAAEALENEHDHEHGADCGCGHQH
ncbi:GTPase [Pseudomonas oryzae]|uniref:Uncharacterized protein n=1 Tax=Pseudomonas oryzae TaxID=1392877 RepID=A0A1H1UL60_9PSED|nr:GTPase [Pseudomonas oryzae]SDS72956.1 hypothetical protein SAMN05216221_2482 [Pseudomonas oryzae]